MLRNSRRALVSLGVAGALATPAASAATEPPAPPPPAVTAPTVASAAASATAPVTLLVTGGTVVTMDADFTVLSDGAVAIAGDRIAAVGSAAELAARFPHAERLDARGRVVMPGLINAHGHAPMVLFRGLADDLPLMEWLEKHIFPAEAEHVDERFVRVGTRLACLEMLRGGTTTFVDMYYFEDAIAEEADRCGIRAVLGETLIDFPAPDHATWDAAVAYTRRFVERWRGHARITAAVAPHAAYTVSDQHLVAAHQLAGELDAPLLIHLAEDRGELERVRQRSGVSSIALLDRLGVLDDRVLAAHVVWPTPDEIALLARRGVGVAHCPQSNMKIAAGVAPVPAMLAAGVAVGIGTDGAGSNNDLDLWEEVDTAAKLHKVTVLDPTVLPARQALAMATREGARALDMEREIGSLEPGKRADLIVVRADGLHQRPQGPAANPYSFLVYATKAGDVETVVVDGRIVVREGRVTTLDEAAVVREAIALRQRIEGQGMTAAAAPPVLARSAATKQSPANVAAFERDLQAIQAALAIPGLAYVIVENGNPIATRAFGTLQGSAAPFTTSTPLRIASVTKSLTAVLAMQLVEEGRLDLDAPARRYVPDLPVPPDVLVRHLLTHTSEGVVGEEYVYGTNRYAMLAKVIAATTGQSFERALRERVIERAGMRAHPSPDLGAHAALVSTVDDMATYLAALDRGLLLTPPSLRRLASPSRSTTGALLPVSLGWFAQTVQGQAVAWSFGQDDPDHSGALLLRLPDRSLSLFVLANANTISDAFRLLMGDVAKSPVATAFLRLFAFSPPGGPLARPVGNDGDLAQALAALEAGTSYRYRDELIAWALLDLWTDRPAEAQAKLDLAATRYGAPDPPDPVLHFAALRLPAPAAKDAAVRAGERLLAEHPHNRWMLLAQGYLLQQQGRPEESAPCFRRILALPNQQPDFLHRLFAAWSWMALAEMAAETNPAEARGYLRNIVESGVGGDMEREAQQILEKLGG